MSSNLVLYSANISTFAVDGRNLSAERNDHTSELNDKDYYIFPVILRARSRE